MSKKLYEATVTIYVVAENVQEAQVVAARVADTEPHEWEVFETTSVMADWWDAIPWGDDESDDTCAQWVKRLKSS